MPGIGGGLFFLAFLTAILLVGRWCMEHDETPPDKTPGGLFAMRVFKPRQNLPPHAVRSARQWRAQELSRDQNQEIE